MQAAPIQKPPAIHREFQVIGQSVSVDEISDAVIQRISQRVDLTFREDAIRLFKQLKDEKYIELSQEWMQIHNYKVFLDKGARGVAVGGIQASMEACIPFLREIFCTKERCTPLRKLGQQGLDPSVVERQAVLLDCLKQGKQLYVVYGKGGVGTPEEDKKFEELRLQYPKQIHDQPLTISKEDLPLSVSSGTVLFISKGEPWLFTITAPQISQSTKTEVIRLFFAPVSHPDAAKWMKEVNLFIKEHGGPNYVEEFYKEIGLDVPVYLK